MMLWQKDSTENDAWYIDLCHKLKTDPEFANIQSETNQYLHDLKQIYAVASKCSKDNQKSVEYRRQGDIEFKMKNYLEAIELYNKSLCHAQSHTPHIALAYAKRAQCFSGMRMIHKCVIDIELAEKANCPADQLAELVKRKQICSNLIRNGLVLDLVEPELDFGPHAMFPEMAKVLAFHRNDEYGRHVIATADIDVGQVLLLEKSFATKTDNVYECCSLCMKGQTNLIPCSTCTTAMHCYNACDENKVHSVECNIQPIFKDHWQSISMAVRTLLTGLNLFANADELMEFVEEAVTNSEELPTSITDARSQYRVCLQHLNAPFVSSGGQNLDKHFALFTPVIYQAVIDHQIFAGYFTNEKQRRFLMHLVYYHMAIGEIASRTFFPIILQFMNHSCVPCINTFLVDGFIIGVAFRPIRRGEQVFKCYFGAGQTKMPFAERQKYLLEHYQFQCQCERCTMKDVPPKQRVAALLSDPNFTFLNRFAMNPDESEQSERKSLMEKTKSVLRKHHQVVWADGFESPITMFLNLLVFKYHNKTEY